MGPHTSQSPLRNRAKAKPTKMEKRFLYDFIIIHALVFIHADFLRSYIVLDGGDIICCHESSDFRVAFHISMTTVVKQANMIS